MQTKDRFWLVAWSHKYGLDYELCRSLSDAKQVADDIRSDNYPLAKNYEYIESEYLNEWVTIEELEARP